MATTKAQFTIQFAKGLPRNGNNSESTGSSSGSNIYRFDVANESYSREATQEINPPTPGRELRK